MTYAEWLESEYLPEWWYEYNVLYSNIDDMEPMRLDRIISQGEQVYAF